MTDFQDVGDRPEIPGYIAQCEWCGWFVNTFTEVPLHYCPNCKHGTLRTDCPYCHAPIAFPPQLNCLGCGKQFTIQKLHEVPGGLSPINIIEPDAERRKELEVKGNHWHDVVRGLAEGPELPKLGVAPPPGWTREDFERRLRRAKVDLGDDLTQPPTPDVTPNGEPLWSKEGPSNKTVEEQMAEYEEYLKDALCQVCRPCGITYILESVGHWMKQCPRCNNFMEPPMLPPGVDKPDAAS